MNLSAEPDRFALQRQRMVENQLRARRIRDERVLAAMARVPRHEFVAPAFHGEAYEDRPLPIGEGQTISQPYMVAVMLEALALDPQAKALEVGAGSGYATALLAELAAEVVAMERHVSLADQASSVLDRLGYRNVAMIRDDGSRGLSARAPYDAILVSAAAAAVPPMLIGQLAEGGRMIIPVGAPDAQQLQLISITEGQPRITLREMCRFVPLVVEGNS